MFLLEDLKKLPMRGKIAIVLDAGIAGLTFGKVARRVAIAVSIMPNRPSRSLTSARCLRQSTKQVARRSDAKRLRRSAATSWGPWAALSYIRARR